MKIRDIEVQDFRKLRHARVSGLTDGANVIAGENEAGKSTILAALQTGLFQRHNVSGKTLAAMQPYGCSVRPSITISFELEDGLYRVRKTFGGVGSAELICPDGGRFANHDADHKLEQLLRFRASNRGPTDFSSLGIWPLFWIEQGTTFQGLDINPDVRATVQSSLTKEVGDVLIGETGERLRRRVESCHAAFFTKTGVETGPLSTARKAVNALDARLAESRQELAALASDVSKLDAALSRRESLVKPELRQELENELKNAQAAVRVLSELDQQIAQTESKRQTASIGRAKARMAHEQRQELIKKIDALEQRAADLRDSSSQLQQVCCDRTAQVEATAVEAARADQALETAKKALQGAENALRCVTTAELSTAAAQRLTKTRELACQLRAAEEVIAQCGITDADVKALQSVERSLIECRAALEGAAPRVDFEFADRNAVIVDGWPLGNRKTILAVDPMKIAVPDGEIHIRPAGGELVSRREALTRFESQLVRTLADLGVESIDAAAAMEERHRTAAAERRTLLAVQKELAPLGIDALEGEYRSLLAQTEAAADRCRGLQIPSRSLAEQDCASAKLALSRAEAQAIHIRALLDGWRQQESDSRVSLTVTTSELNGVTRELRTVVEKLSTARTQATDEAIAHDLADCTALEAGIETVLTDLTRQRTSLDPEAIAVQVNNSERALQRLSEQVASVEREISGLQGRLDGLGEKGIGESCAALEAELALARVRLRATEEEANAVRVLRETLLSAEREANQLFLQPVVRRVQPYLNRVLPGSRIELGTDLSVEGLRRDGTVEPFFALSVGVREQLSVITRVSFADMLAEEGVHAPIILDDALVYADEQRFASTLTTLAVAANRHQIIVLTCHEDRYLRLGCPIGAIEQVSSVTSATV